jgi:lipopolysaccharide heptosyltransferase II
MSERLVILSPNWLGDAVMALPAIADVRRAMPGRHVAIAARPSIAPLFDLVDGIDEQIAISSGHAPLEAFDIALLLPNAFRTALATWRAGVPERWGYRADGRALLLTRAVPPPSSSVHQVDYYRHLVASLGFANGSAEPRVRVPDAARESASRLLSAAGWDARRPLVALAPGAAYGSAKRWPPEYFAELAADLSTDGVQAVIVGSAADVPTSAAVAALFQARRGAASSVPGLIDLSGTTDLSALAGVFTLCRTLVTNDSGAMHLAAAAGVAVTAVFGPTRDRETRPIGPRHAVLTNDVWCRPCMLRDCPLDHRCLRGLEPSAVAEAARRTL